MLSLMVLLNTSVLTLVVFAVRCEGSSVPIYLHIIIFIESIVSTHIQKNSRLKNLHVFRKHNNTALHKHSKSSVKLQTKNDLSH